TSFASVFVYPEIDESIEVEINPADLRIDVYRASGAGGQHVNKTESAVRITHTPTGIVVQSQNDRSQHRNRAECMAMLKSRLYELELRKLNAEADKLKAAQTDIEWGHQIRSYVLDQSRIKDLRTGVEMEQEENKLVEERREKLKALRAKGNAYPNDFRRRDFSGALHSRWGEKSKEELEKQKPPASVAVRMVLKRVMGKASFATLQDGSGRIQAY